MSRQEDFKQASQSLEVQVISNPWTLFEKGCEHGYQYAVDKIFKCIEDQAIFGWIEDIEVDKFLEKIRKAMEE